MRRQSIKTCMIVFVCLSVLTVCGHAQYSITWHGIDGGGGTSLGGNYTLTGTIGQADAGKMSSGPYELTGGFLSIVTAIQTPGAPLLTVTRRGSNVVISWPEPSAGFGLEEISSLSSPASSAVWNETLAVPAVIDGKKQITVPAPVGKKYFRLRKP